MACQTPPRRENDPSSVSTSLDAHRQSMIVRSKGGNLRGGEDGSARLDHENGERGERG